MDRRSAIKTIGALGAAAGAQRLLGACGGPPGSGGGGGDGGLPPGIDHIVVLMMENRSYDHFLGSRSLVEGLPGDGMPPGASNKNKAGQVISAFPAEIPGLCVADPPHNWNAARVQFDAGACDGFVIADQNSNGDDVLPDVMSYLTRSIVPVSYALADAYTSCDRWFSSVLGPTWPNRMYVHSGQSDGVMSNEIPPGGFTWPTIWHRLDAAGIDWAYYFSDIPAIALVDNLDLDGRVRRVLYEFIDDCASGKLPPVAYVDPAFGGNDDHPPHDPRFGQQFISLIYNALVQSPLWSRTLLIQIYDENGGFYDHVPPPKAADDRADQGFDQLGFRIPAIIIGPWVKKGFVSSAIHDHTSCLAQIEHRFGLDPLTKRDAAALDLTDCIDAEALAANTPLEPASVPAVEIDESKLSQACYGNDFLKHGDILAWADQAALPPRWDLRGTVRDQLYEIGDLLDRWGAGRIVRGR